MVTMEPGKIVDARTLKASDHVKALDPVLLVITALTACLGAIIGLELITRVGVTQNTSITGALLAVVLSMIPLPLFKRFRNIHAQNLVQTSISGATYAAANAMIMPIGVPVLMGRSDLMFPMLIGATLPNVCGYQSISVWYCHLRNDPGSGQPGKTISVAVCRYGSRRRRKDVRHSHGSFRRILVWKCRRHDSLCHWKPCKRQRDSCLDRSDQC